LILSDYPRGWVYLRATRKYYRAIFELMDWKKADMRCRELGAYSRLIDINDYTENTAVKRFIASFDGKKLHIIILILIIITRHRPSTSMYSQTFCHSNATRAPIVIPPNSAQLGNPLSLPKLHRCPCNSVGMRPQTDRQTDTQTDRHTHTQTRVTTIDFARVVYDSG